MVTVSRAPLGRDELLVGVNNAVRCGHGADRAAPAVLFVAETIERAEYLGDESSGLGQHFFMVPVELRSRERYATAKEGAQLWMIR